MTTINLTIWNALQPKVRGAIIDYAKYPTERNHCYAVGYMTAAYDNGGLLSEHYNYLLAALGAMQRESELISSILEVSQCA